MTHDAIPYGLCHCGCGEKTPIARDAEAFGRYGKGEPRRYVVGHNRRGQTFPLKVTIEPPNASGICECGCGLPTPIATRSDTRSGHIRGEAMRFCRGHNGRKRPHIEQEPRPCACGCGELTTVYQGLAKAFVHGHNAELRAITGADYVVEDRGYETPCWLWQHAISNQGAGTVTLSGVKTTAYRGMYIQTVGEPGPDLILHHRCEVRECIRPDHLQPMTQADHMRLHRALEKQRRHD